LTASTISALASSAESTFQASIAELPSSSTPQRLPAEFSQRD